MSQKLRYCILVTDLLWSVAALLFAFELRYGFVRDDRGSLHSFVGYLPGLVGALLVWTVLSCSMNLDGFRGGWHFPAIFSQLIVAVSVLMTSLLAFAFLARHYYSRLLLLYFGPLLVGGFIFIRCVVRFLLGSRLRNGAAHRTVIVGQGNVARELAGKLACHPEMPFQVVGFLYPSDAEPPAGISKASTGMASVRSLEVLELLQQQKIQKLLITMPQLSGTEMQKLIAGCRKMGMQVYLVPQWYDLYVSKAKLLEVDGLPLLSLEEHRPSEAELALKRGIDLVLGSLFLVLSSPLLALAATALYWSKGKAFKSEIRCGKDGVPFLMYRLNIDRQATNLVGYERLLAQTSLTELPQIWNVLRGEMSLVGPRPESPERVKVYSDWQRQRLRVTPGLTGLAQVHGLREQHPSEEKARFDLQYIFHSSAFADLSLLLQTLWTLTVRALSRGHHAVGFTEEMGRLDDVAFRRIVNVDRT